MREEKEKALDSKLSKKYDSINQLAKTCWELKQSNHSEFNNKLTLMYLEYYKTMVQRFSDDPKAIDIIINVFASQWGYKDKLDEEKQTWTPEKVPFAQGCIYLIKKRLYGNQQDPAAVELPEDEKDTPINETPLDYVVMKENMTKILCSMNNVVEVRARTFRGIICYEKLYYTEFMATILNRAGVNFVMPDSCIPSGTEEHIDLAFADSFLEHEIRTLADMRDAPLKSTACEYPLPASVYQAYIQQKTGQRPADSTISDQRKNFRKLMKRLEE